MRRLILATTLALATGGCASAPWTPVPVPASGPRLIVRDSLLAARIASIEARSPTFRRALAALEAQPVAIVVVTTGAVKETMPEHVRKLQPGQTVRFTHKEASRPPFIIVIVNPALLRHIQERGGASDDAVLRDLDHVLIHEIYGHAIPYSASAGTGSPCLDMLCAIPRENSVRREMGASIRRERGARALEVYRVFQASRAGHALRADS